MTVNSNVQIIQNIYSCFGKGDIESILALLGDDVRWEESDHAEIPYRGKRTGKPAVRDFFTQLAQVQVSRFEPQEFVASGDRVFVIGTWSGSAKPTGKSFSSDWIMIWTVKGGKVTSYRAYEDTAAIVKAFTK